MDKYRQRVLANRNNSSFDVLMGHGVQQMDDVTRKPMDNRILKERPQSHLPSSKRTWYPENKNMTQKVAKVMEQPVRLDEDAVRRLRT